MNSKIIVIFHENERFLKYKLSIRVYEIFINESNLINLNILAVCLIPSLITAIWKNIKIIWIIYVNKKLKRIKKNRDHILYLISNIKKEIEMKITLSSNNKKFKCIDLFEIYLKRFEIK